MKILLIANEQKDKDFALANKIVEMIGSRASVYVEKKLEDKNICGVEFISENEYEEMDLFLVLGGDGTFLSVAKISAELGIPVVGVNLGRLGFLAEIEVENLNDDLDKLLDGKFEIQNRMMIEANLSDGSKAYGLNDIVVARGNSFLKILEFDIFIDDEFVDSFKADGVIVSTPTGSTAYSLSAGGPIVDPSMDIMTITPICPHKMYSRTIIVPSDKKITVKNRSSDSTATIIAADSKNVGEFLKNDSIVIGASEKCFRLVKLHGLKFFSVLHNKLVKKED